MPTRMRWKKDSQENMYWGDLNAVRHEEQVLRKQYCDDLSGEEVDPSMVMAARSEELKEFVNIMSTIRCH